jgi:hypothetical protein
LSLTAKKQQSNSNLKKEPSKKNETKGKSMLHQGALKASAGIKRTDKKKEESKVFMSVDTSRIESDKVKTNDSFT